jgi:hypothetical protein
LDCVLFVPPFVAVARGVCLLERTFRTAVLRRPLTGAGFRFDDALRAPAPSADVSRCCFSALRFAQ